MHTTLKQRKILTEQGIITRDFQETNIKINLLSSFIFHKKFPIEEVPKPRTN